jgi:polyisoprenoid-binding protein YceI
VPSRQRKGVMKKFILTALFAFCMSAAFAAEYAIDKVHSSIGFAIRHMMVSKTTGTFNDFDGTIKFDPKDLGASMFDITIKAATIDTKNEARDGHLRSADFFEVETYPLIVFRTKKIVHQDGDVYLLTGDLTMKKVTKEIEVPVTVLGPVKNPMTGVESIGLEAHVKVDRQDYGVNWNKTLDNGGLLIGNDVDVTVAIEAGKK